MVTVGMNRSAKTGQLTTSLQLSFLTGLQIAVAFGVQWYVVARLGIGAQTDALYAGLTVPQIVMVLGIESLVFVLVPFLSKRTCSQIEADVWQFMGGLGLLFTGIAVAIILTASWFVPLLVPGFSQAGKELTVSLTRIQALGVIGALFNAILCSFYQARNKFIRPALAILLSSIAGWSILFLGLNHFGVKLAGWAQVLMLTGPALILFPGLGWPKGVSYNPAIFREVWRGTRPIVLSSAYGRTGVILDRILASFLAPGSLVALDLAQRMNAAVSRILTQGMVTPIVPDLARLAHAEQWERFRSLYRQKAFQVFGASALLLVAALFGGYMLQLPAMSHWADKAVIKSVLSVWTVAFSMSGVLLCASLNHTITSAYYSAGNTATPNKLAVLGYTLGLIFKVAGFYMAGVNGMALALSLQYVITAFLLIHHMRPASEGAHCAAQEVFSNRGA
jgi:putative peptidoglycan lipid II flippase